MVFTRSFAKAAVTALLAAFGFQRAAKVRGFVGPDDDFAAVALCAGVGSQQDSCADIGVLRVDNIGVLALKIATDQNGAAACIARDVDNRTSVQTDTGGAQNLNDAAFFVHQEQSSCLYTLSACSRWRGRTDQTGHLRRSSTKNAHAACG